MSHRPSWLTRNVIALGAVSLLTDAASEMAMPLLPAFLTGVLGAGPMAIGWIEGTAEAVSSVLKLVSGRVADRMGRNRPLIFLGYCISSAARPFLGAVAATWHAAAIRAVDRVGKGLRTSPRDALLAASVAEDKRGAAFGFHRAMDHLGAVIGPLLAVAFLSYWSSDLRLLFYLTAIPGFLAVAAILVGVREQTPPEPYTPPTPPPASPRQHEAASVPDPPRGDLLRFLVPLGIFSIGKASELFLLLKAGAVSSSLTTLPWLWMALHVVKSASSTPGGRLADRIGRRRVLAVSWALYAAVFTLFAFTENRVFVWALFLVYGLCPGLSEGTEKAIIAALSPKGRRGSTFGWYHLQTGVLGLVASVLFGALWDHAGSRAAFLASAAFAAAGTAALIALWPRKGRHAS